jgi:hypothetical protein
MGMARATTTGTFFAVRRKTERELLVASQASFAKKVHNIIGYKDLRSFFP